MNINAHTISDEPDPYAARGVEVDRDSAHVIIAALRRDAYEMRERGGEPNIKGADKNDAIATAIGEAIA